MKMKLIRTRLPVSYALIALLTTVVLGSILLLMLQGFYRSQEKEYLSTNASLMAPGLTQVIEEKIDATYLQIYTQNLSYLIQARIRLLGNDDEVLADSGSIKTQKFVYTNLTPKGMSAEILPEGRSERYLFHASINVLAQSPDSLDIDERSVFLAQMPSAPALFGVTPGTQGSQEPRLSNQVVTMALVSPAGQSLGTLEVSEGLAFGGTIIENVARAWLWASFAAVMIAAVSGWFVGRRLTAPLTELASVTDLMAAGDLSARAEIKTQDEFFALGQSFNVMADKIESSIATLRDFLADSAHELLTPVAALRLNLELADEEKNYRQFLREAQNQAGRLQALVDSLLDLSKIESAEPQFEEFSLTRIIEDIEGEFLPLAAKRGNTFSIQMPQEEVFIAGNKDQIHTALENLVDNAFKFSRKGGKVDLKLEITDQEAIVCVQDDGIGIPEEERSRAFQRFFRGRNASSLPGSGLGLAIVKAIADRHAADIDLESSEDGTTVSIAFQQ
jgi:signal transduction histidine kinase